MLSVVLFTICPKFKWKSMEKLTEKLEETRNQMNIDTLLQKISLYEKSFQCLFDDDQIILLYLQEKLSISEVREQRMIMNLEHQEGPNYNSRCSGSKVSNLFLTPESVRGSVFGLGLD